MGIQLNFIPKTGVYEVQVCGPQTSVRNLIRKSEETNHWEDQDIDGDTIKFHL